MLFCGSRYKDFGFIISTCSQGFRFPGSVRFRSDIAVGKNYKVSPCVASISPLHRHYVLGTRSLIYLLSPASLFVGEALTGLHSLWVSHIIRGHRFNMLMTQVKRSHTHHHLHGVHFARRCFERSSKSLEHS